ncbi:hypothetical protein Acr_00g0088840 [Actinidia rufa]|uniref:Uncharacterized protein n=1 Tax=Actinidia rufa TaxID=165716 RepID=A0A7J0DYB7_9ERIC|nr:hypothetical protein Acr_00g0088840 [Actinidia rufa]
MNLTDDTLVTSSSTKFIEFKWESFRFEKELTINDVEHGMISFPYSIISDYFPSVAGKLPRNGIRKIKLTLTDDYDAVNSYTTEADSVELARGAECVFIFEMKVRCSDFEDGRLILHYKKARESFPEIEIPPETHEMERKCFTDALNKYCFMEVEHDAYVIQEGGKEFVDSHDLKSTDVMKFYEPG